MIGAAIGHVQREHAARPAPGTRAPRAWWSRRVRAGAFAIASAVAAIVGSAAVQPVAAQSATAQPAAAAAAKPQHGGTLNICGMYCTLTPLSWDLADWNWKTRDDTGLYFESLFAADLGKAIHRGGKFAFRDNNFLPTDAMRGELAERWRWTDPLHLEVTLRKGVMFPEKKGVMAARELTADDVVATWQYLSSSPKAIKYYWEHVDNVEALDRHTVRYSFNAFSAEWDMRSGYGHYSGIAPRELLAAGAGDWRRHVGTGPFQVTDVVAGNSVTYQRNAEYWDRETLAGQAYRLPFVDRVVVRTIKDEAAQVTALRTAKLDVLEVVAATSVDELKKTAPALKWSRWVGTNGHYLSLRMDTKPFDDLRVRRALNMAIDKQAIIDSIYGGDAEMLAFPMHPDWIGYHEPLSAMPEPVRELFRYDPAKARALLAEAGYPNGFTFKVQVCSCVRTHLDLLAMIGAYYEKIGVKIEIQPMEYTAFFSVMQNKSHAAGYMMSTAHGSPTISVSKLFRTGLPWNTAIYADPDTDAKIAAIMAERAEPKRQQLLKDVNREVLAKAPYVWLPTPIAYSAWWPWVQNYGGELRGGGGRAGPVYARIWIDQAMKKRMGF